MGTRRPEIGCERGGSGIGLGHSAVRGPAVSSVCTGIAVKPPSAPARFLLSNSNYYAFTSEVPVDGRGSQSINHGFIEIEFYTRGIPACETKRGHMLTRGLSST